MARVTTTQPSLTLALISHLIVLTEQDIHRLSQEIAQGGDVTQRQAASAAGGESSPQTQLEDLDLVLDHLKQIRDWLTNDARLLPLVDEYIGKRVQAMEQRQLWQNILLGTVTTVAGVVLGWLASLLATPQAMLRLLGH